MFYRTPHPCPHPKGGAAAVEEEEALVCFDQAGYTKETLTAPSTTVSLFGWGNHASPLTAYSILVWTTVWNIPLWPPPKARSTCRDLNSVFSHSRGDISSSRNWLTTLTSWTSTKMKRYLRSPKDASSSTRALVWCRWALNYTFSSLKYAGLKMCIIIIINIISRICFVLFHVTLFHPSFHSSP